MENLVFVEIKKYIGDVLDAYGISHEHIIQPADSTKPYKIIQISPSNYLSDVINRDIDTFKTYIIQIINSVLPEYTIDYLDIQLNNTVIWVIYSYTNPSILVTMETKLPEEIYSYRNNVWSFGINYSGQLGIGQGGNLTRNIPTKILDITGKSVSCGNAHTVIIDINDVVWAFGNDYKGQLGLGDKYWSNHNQRIHKRHTPTKITPNSLCVSSAICSGISAKFVSCGYEHTVIIDMNNEVWSFGSNEFGQLGLGDNTDRNTPTKIISVDTRSGITAKSVSCGKYYTMIIDMNNNVWAFGFNKYGILGLGNDVNILIPEKINGVTSAKYISCGDFHTVIIDMNNDIFSFGYNTFGQLGLGDNMERNTPTKIPNIFGKSVSCGSYHTVIIDMNDESWSFGRNNFGQLGVGDNMERNTPTKIPNIFAKSVSCGEFHTVIININNDILSFGKNTNGELGLGDHIHRNIPTKIPDISAKSVSCGGAHTVIIEEIMV